VFCNVALNKHERYLHSANQSDYDT